MSGLLRMEDYTIEKKVFMDGSYISFITIIYSDSNS